jgi:predicted dehydrogenase
MHNERPMSVTAVLQTLKPDVYPHVDDMATIILTYPHAQAVIQGSWNWSVDRKDMEIYGKEGYVKAVNANDVEFRRNRNAPLELLKITELPVGAKEPFNYFAKVILGEIVVKPTDLASSENNLIVVEILNAAKQSAREGRTIYF